MFFQNPLEKKFIQWGRSKQALPDSAGEMKEKVVATAKLNAQAVPTVYPSRFYFKLLSGGLAVMLLFVVVDLGRQKIIKNRIINTVGYDTSPGYTLLGLGKKEQSASSNLIYGGGGMAQVSAPSAAYNESDPLAITDGATGLGSKDIVTDAMDRIGKVTEIFSSSGEGDYYQQNRSTPIADDRELLKYSYNSNIQTRDVEEIATKILTIVRGYKGRVDSARINDSYASVSFVVPKDGLFSFKQEIKALVGKRFYQENLYLQNLLPEKVYLEDSTKAVADSLAATKEKLKELTDSHNKSIASLQRSSNSINAQIAKLKAEVTSDVERQKQIKAEISNLVSRQGVVQRQIADENKWYGWDKTRLEEDVKNTQTQLDSLATQNKQLDQNVETVQGNINIQWVSIHEMLGIYVPYYWAWIIGLCVLALIINSSIKRRTIIVS